MKRTLLITSLLISGATFAQFEQSNEPMIGATQSYFLIDTLAPDYAGITGDGVTWDYRWAGSLAESGTPLTTTMTISNPIDVNGGDNYPSATKAVEIDGYMTSFFSSSTGSRNSKGFTFDGNVINFDDSNDELLMNYPFAYGNTLTDAFTGTATSPFGPIALTGTITASVDGRGTLIQNDATTVPNVLRYKIVESASGTTPLGPIVLSRTQYEYYSLTGNNLPLFVHSKVIITLSGAPLANRNIVMNSVQPDGFAGVNESALTGVAAFPNPANDQIFVDGLKDAANLTLIDAQGKTVVSAAVQPGLATMNVEAVDAGIYFLNIATEKGTKTERMVIR